MTIKIKLIKKIHEPYPDKKDIWEFVDCGGFAINVLKEQAKSGSEYIENLYELESYQQFKNDKYYPTSKNKPYKLINIKYEPTRDMDYKGIFEVNAIDKFGQDLGCIHLKRPMWVEFYELTKKAGYEVVEEF